MKCLLASFFIISIAAGAGVHAQGAGSMTMSAPTPMSDGTSGKAELTPFDSLHEDNDDFGLRNDNGNPGAKTEVGNSAAKENMSGGMKADTKPHLSDTSDLSK